jgi:hypothetical protein
MNAREERAFARLESFATKVPILVGSEDVPPMYQGFLEKLQTSLARLGPLIQEQYEAAPQRNNEGLQTAKLRKRLRREYMIPLTRIGRRLLRFAPGVEPALRVPHARASHRELITTAEVMLKAVRPHRALFVEAGFRKTFFTEFRDVTKALKSIVTTGSQRQKRFARVSEKLREELASATETLRILDGLMLGRADRDSNFARTWKELLRTPKRLGRPRTKRRRVLSNGATGHGSREETLRV